VSSTPNLLSKTSITSSAAAPAGKVAGAAASRLASRPQTAPGAHAPGVSPGISPETARGHCTLNQQTPIPAEETINFEETGGWDAYDVWRRFIKEARERRRHPG